MEVLYEPPIVDRLHDVHHAALRENKTVYKVLLTKQEMNELRAFVRKCGPFPDRDLDIEVDPLRKWVSRFMGMKIEQVPDER